MSFIDEVRADREPLAHVLKKHRGIRKIVENLYPDRAHFIYELLQNAEDQRATEASFLLEKDRVSFEHNGATFTEQNVWDITDIGEPTKLSAEDKIGRFGVGFKAVFAYSETPYIWSPTFSFKITELVSPTAINSRAELGHKTRFEFPFNNPKKNSEDAYTEVAAGLNELVETTLLFLSNLECIRWQIGKSQSGEILRLRDLENQNHIEVLKRAGDKTTASAHFLCFSDSVEGLERQHVSVAFALDCLPNISAFDPKAPLASQLKIIPADPGRVAVFFPAEKETSGLRFHLHAPFVPELSRASVKETSANDPLFMQLAKLAADALHSIRDQNLLTSEMLAVLPNPHDSIPQRYDLIRAAIIKEMNTERLTPTYSRSHAPAKYLVQAKASLKDLLSDRDLEFLIDYQEEAPQWAIGASQRYSNQDRFLSGLAIGGWDIDEFVELIRDKIPAWGDESDADFMEWLAAKSLDWHQQMYSLLYKELAPTGDLFLVKDHPIIRLSDGSYSVASKCYFPSDDVEHDEILPRVAREVYSAGKSKTQHDEARKFLEESGVRKVGETEQVEAILKQRYTFEAEVPDRNTYLKDLQRFIGLVEKEPQQAKLFNAFYVFEQANEMWAKASGTYVDLPVLDTGLSSYYDALGPKADRMALSNGYLQLPVSRETFLKFAEKVGVQVRLEVKGASCYNNAAVRDLVRGAPGGWSTSYGINRDYTIEGLRDLLGKNNEALSRLVWRTVCDKTDNSWLQAQFRNNSNYSVRKAASQLVCTLRDSAWIPQMDGQFVLPSKASRELLPKGFPYDEGYEWLKAIGFGEQNRQSVEESKKKETTAKDLGFADVETLERAKQFAALPQADQEQLLAEFQRRQYEELPDHEPRDPERRAEHVAQEAANAPERITEERTRSVSVGREDVKQEAEQYLREQYTNAEEEMFCQVCKHELPFKLDDGRYYFEKVELLTELTRRHYQNYLALCPNHSAMFQHVNSSRDVMKGTLYELVGNELEVVLAQRDTTIFFTKTHIADLRKIIEVDSASDALDSGSDIADS